jgi:ATP-dependent DNA helicase RecQ
MKARDVLKKYWGFDDFRPNQIPIIDSIINGKDTLALLPTGGGKSICYQVPGLLREGICLVVSPLIALMQDQVNGLTQLGIKAAAITSDLSRKEIDIILDNAKFGGISFLYVSPERLKTEIFIARFKQMKVGLIAVDEAHCISEWGHDFRPPYKDIWMLREIHPDVPIIALTATATQRVREDIIAQLRLKQPNYFEGSFYRDNLTYEMYISENKLNDVIKTCKLFHGQCGVVYCQTRRDTKEVTKALLAQGLSAATYHGGLSAEIRKEKLQFWLTDRINIMVATNAFGMGIDKPNVRFVVHYEIPNNIEAYYQEAGRSGRDGKASRNIAFIENSDLKKMQERVASQFPAIDTIKLVYKALCNHLSVAIGAGQGESYPIAIRDFTQKFQFEPLLVYNSFKILELNGTIVFNEDVFQQTRLKFAVSNTGLYNFQLKNPKLDPLITILSRSYPGIFSNFWEISEKKIAERLKLSVSEVKSQLQYLEKQGVIDITWTSENPLITFQHERLPDGYLDINPEVYSKRKQIIEDKLQAMLKLVRSNRCRSLEILEYFGQEGTDCGKCDNCKANQVQSLSPEEIRQAVLEQLNKGEITFHALLEQFGSAKKTNLIKALNFLISEEVIQQHGENFRLASDYTP